MVINHNERMKKSIHSRLEVVIISGGIDAVIIMAVESVEVWLLVVELGGVIVLVIDKVVEVVDEVSVSVGIKIVEVV